MKPGLSSFADNPKEGAAIVQALINEAYGIVPESYRKDTPVSMKATAGGLHIQVRIYSVQKIDI